MSVLRKHHRRHKNYAFDIILAKLSAQGPVTEINSCFETFDGIRGKYGVEKIKTIGDAYMAVEKQVK